MTKKSLYFGLFVFAALFAQNCSNGSGDLEDQHIVVYSSGTITEDAANDGTFDATITATVSGTEFKPSLTAGVDFDTIDLPAGLSTVVTSVDATTVAIHISGVAASHSFCFPGQAAFFFKETAFIDEKRLTSLELPIVVNYFAPTLSYSASKVQEDAMNHDGSFPSTIIVTASSGGGFTHLGSPATANQILTEGTDYSWSIPSGLTPVLRADATNPTGQINISFVNSATSSSPVNDVTTTLTFDRGLSSSFCAVNKKKKIDFEFERDVVMYHVLTTSGNLQGRVGADQRCYVGRPILPDVYTRFRAFLSVGAADEIRDMATNFAVPTNQVIESITGQIIDNNFPALLDTNIAQALSGVGMGVSSTFWTGSNPDGSIGANNCVGWTSASSASSGISGASGSADGNWLNDTVGGAQLCNKAQQSILCLAYIN